MAFEKISEDETLSKNIKLENGDFIVVKYEMSKRNILFVAQVDKEETPLIKVNFLRKKNNLDGLPYLIFPQISDRNNITRSQIVRKLAPAKILKRGRFSFNIDTSNFN